MYFSRTGDVAGANKMLALKAPGSQVDVAPSWVVTDATSFSKSEHQRDERVRAAAKYDAGGGFRWRNKNKNSKGEKRDKGGGKGDKGAKGAQN